MMPKEKAKEIIESFTYSCKECDNTKLSALKTVDELIKDLNDFKRICHPKNIDAFKFVSENTIQFKNYWEKVKKEIELL